MIRPRVLLAAFLLGLPLIGAGVGLYQERALDHRVRASIAESSPGMPAAVLEAFSLADLCRARRVPVSTECRLFRGYRGLSRISATMAVWGVVLVAGIAVAAQLASRDRRRLLALFRPGLYLTAIAIAVIVLGHGLIAIMAIVFLTGTFVSGPVLAIAIGMFAGAVAVIRNVFSVVKTAESDVIGRPVSSSEAPALWQLIDGVADRLGALKPDHVVVGLDPSFFVTEARVRAQDQPLEGRTLYCSLPFARILTVGEFASIVGHELGHFRGEDTKFSERFYPIYRGSTDALNALENAGEGLRAVALLPAFATLGFFLDSFAVAERAHVRQREHVADAAGAEATDVKTAGVALVKVHAFGDAWGAWQAAAAEQLRAGQLFTNASAGIASLVQHNVGPQHFQGIAEERTSHPTDTHPPLGDRLESLGVRLDDLIPGASVVDPTDAAIGLVTDAERIEEQLSLAYQGELARALGIKVKAPATGDGSRPRTCTWCGSLVVPTAGGRCPSCQARL